MSAPSESSTPVQLDGDHVALHHTEGPFDLVRARWMGAVTVIGLSKLVAQPPPKARHGPLSQVATVGVGESGGVVRESSFVEPHPFVVHQRGLTSDDRDDVALGDVFHQWHEFMTDAVTPKRRTVVGLVVQGDEPRRGDELVQRSAAKVTQRLGGVTHHGREPVNTRAPQHVEQHGLNEIVHRVTGQHRNRHRPSTRGARPGFEVPARFDGDVVTDEGHAELRAELSYEGGVLRALWSRVVVNVVHGDGERLGHCQQQQTEGIGSARDREVDRRTGRWKVTVVEQQTRVEVHAFRLRNGPPRLTGAP